MKRNNFSVAMANMVMEIVSELEANGEKASMRHIKERLCDKYGTSAEKYIKYVPQYVKKGVGLGLIGKFGDNFRTQIYEAKRRRKARGVAKKRKRSRRRRRK